MKLKLTFSVFLLVTLFPGILLAQNGPSVRPKPIRVAAGDDLSNLFADLDKLILADNDEKAPQQPLSRVRVVTEQRSASAEVRPIVTVPSAPVSPGSPVLQQMEREAFALINQQRNAQGLPSLIWSDEVARVARMHSQNMATYKFFDHRGLDGKMVNDRADSIGLNKWRALGENIAFMRGYAQPADFAVKAWMNSPSHRHNLLGPSWRETAVGVAVASDGSYYFTQVFLERR